MRPLDTHEDAYELQLHLYRQMSAQRKGEMAAELSNAVRSIARQGIRVRHPEFSDAEVSRELIRILFGEDVAVAIWSQDTTSAT